VLFASIARTPARARETRSGGHDDGENARVSPFGDLVSRVGVGVASSRAVRCDAIAIDRKLSTVFLKSAAAEGTGTSRDELVSRGSRRDANA
jgi:hypothetical protein